MPLSVTQIEAEWPKQEYEVAHGQLRVGLLSYAPSESRWCWTIDGIAGGPDDLLRAGVGATLPAARAQMDEQWARWLAYAKLEPIEPNGAHAVPPRRRADQE
jgi:hypothetical protein